MPAVSSEGHLGLLVGMHGPLWSSLCDVVLQRCGLAPQNTLCRLADHVPPTLQADISLSLSSLSRF